MKKFREKKQAFQGDDEVIGKYPKLGSARSSEQSNLARKRVSIVFAGEGLRKRS